MQISKNCLAVHETQIFNKLRELCFGSLERGSLTILSSIKKLVECD